jgi:hypothetical protein
MRRHRRPPSFEHLPPRRGVLLGVVGAVMLLAAAFALIRFAATLMVGPTGTGFPDGDSQTIVAHTELDRSQPTRPERHEPEPDGYCMVAIDGPTDSGLRLDGRACSQVHQGDSVTVRVRNGRMTQVAGWPIIAAPGVVDRWAVTAAVLGVAGALLVASAILVSRPRGPRWYFGQLGR